MGPPLRRRQSKITDNRQNLLVKYVGAQYFVPVRCSNCVETGSPVPVRTKRKNINRSKGKARTHGSAHTKLGERGNNGWKREKKARVIESRNKEWRGSIGSINRRSFASLPNFFAKRGFCKYNDRGIVYY